MKKTIIALIFAFSSVSFAYYGTGSNSQTTNVKGHYRSNGTYVNGYTRTKSNNDTRDNYNAEGNYNPNTGRTGNKKYKPKGYGY